MSTFYDSSDIMAAATPAVALEAAREGLTAEANGSAVLPPRLDVPTDSGFIRCMPAVLGEVMGLKVMTLVRGLGTRYLVLLYRVDTGQLDALFDADQLTATRTAAITTIAGELMASEQPSELSVIGTGFEARNHLLTMATHWPLKRVRVWSRSAENRHRFAREGSAQLGIEVTAADSCEEAIRGARTVVMATKSSEPVLEAGFVDRGAVVLSIGSTRPDLRELDVATLGRAGTLVVDSTEQVLAESGDIIEAIQAGLLERDRIVPVAAALADPSLLRREGERDLLVFKSVGTALQDLALAAAIHRTGSVGGRDLGDLSSLKAFIGSGTAP